jgi:hypothetical protein
MPYKLFGVADYELDIRFVRFKIADPKMAAYCEKKKSYCPKNMYYKLFGAAAYKSDINFIKFKMADPKWRTYFEKKIVMALKVCRYYKVVAIADYEFEIRFIKFKKKSYLLISSEQFK